MGKRIEVTPYRHPARVLDVTQKDARDIKAVAVKSGRAVESLTSADVVAALDILDHKRSVKAAQMRRYRAKKAGKK